MIKTLTSLSLGVASFALVGTANAAPVTFELTGVVSGADGRGIVGIPGVFPSQSASISFTWDTDVVQGELSNNPLAFNNALSSFEVTVGSITYDFIQR